MNTALAQDRHVFTGPELMGEMWGLAHGEVAYPAANDNHLDPVAAVAHAYESPVQNDLRPAARQLVSMYGKEGAEHYAHIARDSDLYARFLATLKNAVAHDQANTPKRFVSLRPAPRKATAKAETLENAA